MIRWFRSLFAWRAVKTAGVWLYQENAVTGRRAARRINSGGHSPLDLDWLAAGRGHPEVDGMPVLRRARGQPRTAYFL